MSTTQTTIEALQEDSKLSLAVRASTQPLQSSGALNKFKFFESTPVIGREYVHVQLSDLLKAENSDELIRELAIVGMSYACFGVCYS